METTLSVRLLDHTPDPLRTMYVAFRTCYSSLTPQQIWDRIEEGKISREKMTSFILEKLQTGHASPRQQIWFTFAVSGIDRSCSHQLVRHHVGITFDQQSQRYVTYKDGAYPYIVPDTWRRAGLAEDLEQSFRDTGSLYNKAVEAGIPGEDARCVLPNATSTNLVFTVNFEEILHIADQRLCWRSQWQIRRFWAKVRGELMQRFPELAVLVQPKCGEHRLGYCDEEPKEWARCPLGKVRPHKKQILEYLKSQGKASAITEENLQKAVENRGDEASPEETLSAVSSQ
ncbi:MAG: FAD-dependent thymidylate synthase [Armatimonadetes bacterium]|nr:FAD-dependent thymidylate synthase [Armatimonadota bacterium]